MLASRPDLAFLKVLERSLARVALMPTQTQTNIGWPPLVWHGSKMLPRQHIC